MVVSIGNRYWCICCWFIVLVLGSGVVFIGCDLCYCVVGLGDFCFELVEKLFDLWFVFLFWLVQCDEVCVVELYCGIDWY